MRTGPERSLRPIKPDLMVHPISNTRPTGETEWMISIWEIAGSAVFPVPSSLIN
jgi:hypothetical protein